MDPIIIGLGAKVIYTLMPYVKKGAEKFAQDVGEAAAQKVKSLYEALKKRLRGDKTATDMLDEFEKDPETYKSVLEKILQKKVEQDKDLAEELSKHLHEIGPILVTDVHVTEADDDVTGGRIKHMKSGEASIKVDVGKAKKEVIGAEIDDFG